MSPDTSGNYMLNGTIRTQVTDKKDRKKKDIKIIFSNDTVQELVVDGNVIPPSDMDEYDATIDRVRSDMEQSHEELNKAEYELQQARGELDRARAEFERSREHAPELIGTA